MRNLSITIYIGFFVQLIDIAGCYISCQFDTGLCGWTPNGPSKYSWQTLSGKSKDRTSGPLNDVTCNNSNGYYAYLPGMYSFKGMESEIESKVVTLNKTSAFKFWYFMNGVGIGSLTLIQKFDDTSSFKLWSKHGEQKAGWQPAKVSLKPGTFSIVIRGSAELPYGSDLAIDDLALASENIEFNTSYCSQTTTTSSTTRATETKTFSSEQTSKVTKSQSTLTSNSQITPSSTIPTRYYSSVCSKNVVNSPLLPGSCNFENNTCDLAIRENENDTEVSWERRNKGKLLLRMSIQHDHTYQNAPVNGYFLNFRNKVRMFRFDKTPNGRNASVETPRYNTTAICLTFWYIMTTNYSNLLVYIKDISDNTLELWSTNTTTLDWTKKQISIQSVIPFKIGFQTRNLNFQAIVGLDDIEIKAGETKISEVTTISPNLSSQGTKAPERIPLSHDYTHDSLNEFPEYTHKQFTSELTTIAREQNRSTKGPSSARMSSTNKPSTTSTPTKPPGYQTMETEMFTRTERSSRLNPVYTSPVVSFSTKIKDLSKTNDKQSGYKYRNSTVVIGYSVGSLALVTVIAFIILLIRRHFREKKATKRHRKMLITKRNSQTICIDSTFQTANKTRYMYSNGKETSNIFTACVNETDVSTKF